jgi:hypothetical protein
MTIEMLRLQAGPGLEVTVRHSGFRATAPKPAGSDLITYGESSGRGHGRAAGLTRAAVSRQLKFLAQPPHGLAIQLVQEVSHIAESGRARERERERERERQGGRERCTCWIDSVLQCALAPDEVMPEVWQVAEKQERERGGQGGVCFDLR